MLNDKVKIALSAGEEFRVGTVLPERLFSFSATHVFMYSAATWNRHQIHYSKDRAIAEGHEDVLVQRGLLGNVFTRYVNSLFTHHFISELDWKVLSSALPNQKLSCQASVTSLDDDSVELSLTLHHEDRLIAQATLRAVSEADSFRRLH